MSTLRQWLTGWTAIITILVLAVAGVLLGGMFRKLLWGAAVIAAVLTGYFEMTGGSSSGG